MRFFIVNEQHASESLVEVNIGKTIYQLENKFSLNLHYTDNVFKIYTIIYSIIDSSVPISSNDLARYSQVLKKLEAIVEELNISTNGTELSREDATSLLVVALKNGDFIQFEDVFVFVNLENNKKAYVSRLTGQTKCAVIRKKDTNECENIIFYGGKYSLNTLMQKEGYGKKKDWSENFYVEYKEVA